MDEVIRREALESLKKSLKKLEEDKKKSQENADRHIWKKFTEYGMAMYNLGRVDEQIGQVKIQISLLED